jgi:hypothetical protein
MRIREIIDTGILIALTNEEARFLNKQMDREIDLKSLSERERRIAENLIFKDVLSKINDNQAMVNKNAPRKIR